MYQGNRVVLRFVVLDEDVVGEPPLNITLLTIKYAIARIGSDGNPITATPLVDLSSTGAQVVKTFPLTGVVEVTLLPANTQSIKPGSYYHELEAFDTLGNGVVSATGGLEILPNVVNV
jgi:hypothetical protein